MAYFERCIALASSLLSPTFTDNDEPRDRNSTDVLEKFYFLFAVWMGCAIGPVCRGDMRSAQDRTTCHVHGSCAWRTLPAD